MTARNSPPEVRSKGKPRTSGANRSKARGTAAETAVTRWLQANGWPSAERRSLRGTSDAGDIAGTPALAWEVRNRRELRLSAWLKDAAKRRRAAGAEYGLLVCKPDGMGEQSVAAWPVVMTLADAVRLLHAAGYGDPTTEETP